VDIHFPHLSVGNTLDFASETKVPRARLKGESRKDFVRSRTDLWTTSLGLRHTLHTKVGNEYVQGISGGERKRVSLSETVSEGAFCLLTVRELRAFLIADTACHSGFR
jgi:ABC-type multidrug transport system ATPase subunit